MEQKKIRFSTGSVNYYFNAGFSLLKKILKDKKVILVTDENVFRKHKQLFSGWDTIVLKPGETNKVQSTIDSLIGRMIKLEADRKTVLVGVGGGVITDITGYAASIYMRGISFGFVPTTLLAMVDASIGGKNGIDVGVYKNMIGTIRQPSFLLYDPSFLQTLPVHEWRNGFAEIIKHACIKDAAMFRELEQHDPEYYMKSKSGLSRLIMRNALLKTKVVQSDEFELGSRKLLNFGHTLGHALENQYELSHGQAVSVGMAYATRLSGEMSGFKNSARVINLLEQYELPTLIKFNRNKVIKVLKMDKKKEKDSIHFILLEKIGKAYLQQLSINQLYENLS